MEVKKFEPALFEELSRKYDMTKLKDFSKEDLIDIVHRAKCRKLKDLDTSSMSREDIITHLVNSKCPEVHSMIVKKEYKNKLS